MKTVGYAIVGTGYFGAELGRIMKEQEGAKIVAGNAVAGVFVVSLLLSLFLPKKTKVE